MHLQCDAHGQGGRVAWRWWLANVGANKDGSGDGGDGGGDGPMAMAMVANTTVAMAAMATVALATERRRCGAAVR
eukprot:13109267-Alexandrium_andersonii.AAC.1